MLWIHRQQWPFFFLLRLIPVGSSLHCAIRTCTAMPCGGVCPRDVSGVFSTRQQWPGDLSKAFCIFRNYRLWRCFVRLRYVSELWLYTREKKASRLPSTTGSRLIIPFLRTARRFILELRPIDYCSPSVQYGPGWAAYRFSITAFLSKARTGFSSTGSRCHSALLVPHRLAKRQRSGL
jgi:hypothetical protein